MMEIIQNIGMALIIAALCGIIGLLLKNKKQQILSITAELIQKAEQAIRGSGLGEEKKALVIAQLEAMGIRATHWLDGAIDEIVALLNKKSAWYIAEAQENICSVTKEITNTATEEIEDVISVSNR